MSKRNKAILRMPEQATVHTANTTNDKAKRIFHRADHFQKTLITMIICISTKFLLWEYLKQTLCKSNPQNLNQLKTNIQSCNSDTHQYDKVSSCMHFKHIFGLPSEAEYFVIMFLYTRKLYARETTYIKSTVFLYVCTLAGLPSILERKQ
jgi:hypothetical protein